MKGRTGFFLALLLVRALVCVGGAFWIHRGFRARSTPAASEAYLARKIRNFAIPASEWHSKNRLGATPENLRQARELFIEHCTSCHGLGGSARTRLGENLYHRVPDLRAAQTQGLSDGELHYIIENGVQLTSRPAFADLHKGSPRGRGCWSLTSATWLHRTERPGVSRPPQVRRLTSLRQVPRGNLRAMEEDTHGERGTRSVRASGR
jgi:mono/diheme cytochrome c family protein